MSDDIILGVDASTTSYGAAIIDAAGKRILYVEEEVYEGRRYGMEQRLVLMHDALQKLYAEFTPNAVYLEQSPFLGHKNATTTFDMGRVAGVLGCLFYRLGVPVLDYCLPLQAKKALTGDGGATKSQMIAAVKRQFGLVVTEHIADAVGVALFGRGDRRREGWLHPLPSKGKGA